ncbi:bifunctional 4-hydroxy-2-oxoglutarate aldolase/2-dehydro-3-deoxy-phosphogluconate aldolase [Candidatus Stoquefichus massiliensis]|uniref:bifunctional 4-hydroxy-2-oxoglutarate aldolase/2-dehydro-3-deoxy-phosphogluconate aldolase n=1 Tax=Candidatus Stoquefichus massiliensis TaxID=1470350 RepID=UPI000482B49A|nr:bifunctional 4-hydroxy-2-oxoglutarate aldolase/2-dehydro-3-deoxy-phosphogluconate aldolase [Candidatus Stoquefichus massiliensis]
MKKSETIMELKKQGVVAVIRGHSLSEGIEISKACIKGGLKAIEMAYTNTSASEIIKQLCEIYKEDQEVCIGAGTVLDAPTARMAILAGAKYIVSPSFDKETAILCNRYGIPYIPGCMTIKEIVTAMEAGSEIIKLFPGSAFGPGYIGAIRSPLPQVSLMVTGGVNLDNVQDWFKAGVDAIGVGGELNKLGAQGKFDEVTEIASQYVSRTREAK